ncbi:MAG: hypothetical protein GPJ54_13770 [Candidatus Heimdallarchaeota archaeon]|nr:hypothetical protein [Candidatus Heimdallarchaeota archaeon]
MWKEPDEKSIDAPLDMKKLMRKSIYWNSEGKLYKSPFITIAQHVIVVFLFSLIVTLFGASYIDSLISNNLASTTVEIIFAIGIFGVSFWYFITWGWKSYREAWYHFDDKDEIFTVIKKSKAGWESIEIPYEDVYEIDYIEGIDGKAIIKSGPFEFETNRDSEKRATSVIDIWDKIARIDSQMKNWRIEMSCQQCQRQFGHNIGTAICPFCKIALIDKKAKGRFDPATQHDDDLDRI